MDKWGNVQFFHKKLKELKNDKRATVAVDVPAKQELLKLAQASIEGAPYKMPVATGIATVHDDDRFEKSKGRDLSFSRLQHKDFEVLEFTFSDSQLVLSLYSNDLVLLFSINPKKGKPHLIYAAI